MTGFVDPVFDGPTSYPQALPIIATIRSACALFARAPLRFIALAAASFLVGLVIGFAHGLTDALMHVHTKPMLLSIVSKVIFTVVAVIAHGAMIIGALEVAKGATFSCRSVLAASASRFWALAAIGCLQALAAGLGAILLVIPGVIAALALLAAQPICLAEGLGPIESLKRSGALTKGSRWRILGILLCFFAGEVVLIGLPAIAFAVAKMPIVLMIVLGLSWLLLTPVAYLLATAIYLQLRERQSVGLIAA